MNISNLHTFPYGKVGRFKFEKLQANDCLLTDTLANIIFLRVT